MEDLSLQVLHKDIFKPSNNGTQIRDWELEETGKDLLKLATEEDILPNCEIYQQSPLKKNHFFRNYFHPDVSWDTIQEFLITKQIYVRRTKTESLPDSSKSPTVLTLWDS